MVRDPRVVHCGDEALDRDPRCALYGLSALVEDGCEPSYGHGDVVVVFYEFDDVALDVFIGPSFAF